MAADLKSNLFSWREPRKIDVHISSINGFHNSLACWISAGQSLSSKLWQEHSPFRRLPDNQISAECWSRRGRRKQRCSLGASKLQRQTEEQQNDHRRLRGHHHFRLSELWAVIPAPDSNLQPQGYKTTELLHHCMSLMTSSVPNHQVTNMYRQLMMDKHTSQNVEFLSLRLTLYNLM